MKKLITKPFEIRLQKVDGSFLNKIIDVQVIESQGYEVLTPESSEEIDQVRFNWMKEEAEKETKGGFYTDLFNKLEIEHPKLFHKLNKTNE